MFLAQDGAALGTGEHFVFADDPVAKMPAARADAQAASTTLSIRADVAVAVVGHDNGLLGRGPAIRFLEDSALLAGAIPAKRAISENRLSGPEVLAAAASRALELQIDIPLTLPVGLRIGRKHQLYLSDVSRHSVPPRSKLARNATGRCTPPPVSTSS